MDTAKPAAQDLKPTVRAPRVRRHAAQRRDRIPPLFIVSAAILVVVLLGVGALMFWAHTLSAQGKAYLAKEVPAIGTNWNTEQFYDHATPELRDEIKPEDLQNLFATAAQLGSFQQYLGGTGGTDLLSLLPFSGAVSASYVVRARFSEGLATFTITLVRRDGRWLIGAFHLDLLSLGPVNRDLLQLVRPRQ